MRRTRAPRDAPRCATSVEDALNTGDPAVIAVTLELLVEFTRASPAVGEALVPYYRQLLPRLNALKDVDDVYVLARAPRRRALVARASTSRERGRGRERRERNAPSRDRTHRSRTIQTQHRQSGASRAPRARTPRRRRRVGQHQISHSHVPFVRARRVSVHTSRASLKYSILHHRSRRRRLSLTVSLSLGLSRASRPNRPLDASIVILSTLSLARGDALARLARETTRANAWDGIASRDALDALARGGDDASNDVPGTLAMSSQHGRDSSVPREISRLGRRARDRSV